MTPARARSVHLVVAAVAWFALAFQLVLVVSGEAILVEDDPPGLVARVYRFFAYFTIQSNALVAITSTVLARDPAEDRPGWRVARLAGLIGITVTGLVYFFLLRGLVELEGPNLVVGYVVIRADLALTGPKGRGGRRAEEAGPHRPEPRRFAEL